MAVAGVGTVSIPSKSGQSFKVLVNQIRRVVKKKVSIPSKSGQSFKEVDLSYLAPHHVDSFQSPLSRVNHSKWYINAFNPVFTEPFQSPLSRVNHSKVRPR